MFSIRDQAVRMTVRFGRTGLMAGLLALFIVSHAQAEGTPPTVWAVRSRQAELHYRLVDAGPTTAVQVWYTRDRGATWLEGGTQTQHDRPALFDAPGEGLYGFILQIKPHPRAELPPPTSRSTVQRWVFIDYTPPLLQWDSVEPSEAFSARRIVRLHWTAHDANFPTRPLTLCYQSSHDQTWQVIEAAMANTSRYDWQVPPELAGQITLRLSARDLGGHVVERLYGPVPLEHWIASGIATNDGRATTRPFDPEELAHRESPTSQPAPVISEEDRRRGQELYDLASWHLLREDYAVAAERLREALEHNPDLLPAMNDLACIHHLQRDYPKAIALFESLLAKNSGYASALRGLHGSYIAQRRYDRSREVLSRLLAINENDAESRLDMGDVLFMMGDVEAAREQWSEALTADASAKEIIAKARDRLRHHGVPAGAVADGSQ